jgi:rubrerythrin
MKAEIRKLEQILEIYAIARQREQAAYDFYLAAANKVPGEEEKKLLFDLAKFELQHLRMMKDRYEATLKKIQDLQKAK